MQKVPKRFQEFMKEHPQISSFYEGLADECQKSGPLSRRECSLVKLGIAAASHMEGAVHSQVRKALDAGLKADEIRHAFLLSLTTIGFPRMMAALTWAEDILDKQNPTKK
jgi:4-carboxymuconolactone decarboxylase